MPVTGTAAFSMAAEYLTGTGLATGILLRVLHRRPYAPMLALIVAGLMLQLIASTLQRDRTGVSWGLALAFTGLGLLAWDAGRVR